MIKNVRSVIFWSIDFIKGKKIRNHYKDIKYIIENPEDEISLSKQKEYLEVLLAHAKTTTTYYKQLSSLKITDFPVVNKEIIKSEYKKFQSRVYKNKKSVSVATSGSTGASFVVHQDYNKKNRNTADIIYFSELTGFELGYRLYYLRFWSMFKKKNKQQSFIQNIIPIDVFDLSSVSIKNLIDRLTRDKSNKGMLGYASIFDKICKYLETNGIQKVDCKMHSIIGMSERLDPETKLAIKKYFGVDMVSRYSNAENGMIAQQPRGKEYFIINNASYYVEILNLENDKKAAQGTLGRIVVTDLFNYNTPIIRYDTGDLGIMDYVTIQGNNVLVLNRVEGRKMDMIRNTSGEILSTSILLVINKYTEIKQRQIIQKTKNEYLFKLKVNGTFMREGEFIEEFRTYLGENASILIEYVDEIPLLSSGKQRAIVNEVEN